MNRERKVTGEKVAKVPAYIVTFSDMVTLLLTFFVLLISLADVQEEALFDIGRESFLRSLRSFGLGMLFGRIDRPNFGNVKIRYYIGKSDKQFEGRIIDAKEEEIRRIFQELSRSMNVMPSQIVAKKTDFSVTNIHFLPGSTILDEPAKRFLIKFCSDLQQDISAKVVKLYVLGIAGDGPTEKEQWILSAKRAQAVADFLQETLPLGSKWPIYSWGAGPGGDWVAQDSPISRQSQILIAVLRSKD